MLRMSPEKRAAEARRVEMQRQAVGDALRALAGGLPVAGKDLPARLAPPTGRPPGIDRFRVGWHRNLA